MIQVKNLHLELSIMNLNIYLYLRMGINNAAIKRGGLGSALGQSRLGFSCGLKQRQALKRQGEPGMSAGLEATASE
jgi:hypothetical protein